jgi:membrane protein DedA with SNARE-associated domain
MALVESISTFAQHVISPDTGIGLPGACFLMALESMIAPVPSEAVMPFVGFLVQEGKFGWTEAIIWTSIGSIVGSIISYYLGYFGGKPLVMKVGRFMLVNEHHLDLTTKWFHTHGGATVFICRFLPIVRHLISIPAGIGRMPLLSFCAYTIVGATLWNVLLMWVGFKLKENWDKVHQYSRPIDMIFIAGCVLVGAIWLILHLKKPKRVEAEVK